LQEAIKKKYGMTAELDEGVAGIFEVYIDGKTVYSNQTTYRFPTDDEIFEQIEAAKQAK
jgi:selT/selW/selH-like putative selenoprotein